MTRERGSGKTPVRVTELLKRAVSEKSMLAVSKATGLGLAAIGRYLKGIGEPTTATLQKLAAYFGVDVDYLTGQGLYRLKDMGLEEAREFRGNTDIRTDKGRANLFRAVAGIIAGEDEGSADYSALRANDFEHWTDSLKGLLERVLPHFDEKEMVIVGNQMIDVVNAFVDAEIKRQQQRGSLYEKLGIDTQEVLDKLKELGYETVPAPPKKPRKGE
jgi:transcriptional regulator with XRE-family HTH domain